MFLQASLFPFAICHCLCGVDLFFFRLSSPCFLKRLFRSSYLPWAGWYCVLLFVTVVLLVRIWCQPCLGLFLVWGILTRLSGAEDPRVLYVPLLLLPPSSSMVLRSCPIRPGHPGGPCPPGARLKTVCSASGVFYAGQCTRLGLVSFRCFIWTFVLLSESFRSFSKLPSFGVGLVCVAFFFFLPV